LWHQHNTPSGDIVWRSVIDSRSSKINDPFSDARIVNAQEPGNRAQSRGLPGAVSAEDRNDLPFSDRQRNALNRSNRALVDDFDLPALEWGRGHLRAPASGLYLNGQSRK